ncbi:hypothetical protein [Erythrobacter aureus]|uniref:Uncharacterized protein n=1 Tax=Erythrobacter aureus TaxID=2182384 RepID=A0A345YJG7_9SPHN|nr:hypothetical protein [Erythrobacter aureus]AXK44069.1 hypothetical protein DVR09_16585 [Erythrobacter aureus]
MKISSIYVDRFGKALKARGVDLKRAALIELLSSTLGYHNSGEFSAAAKRGDLTPLQAQPLGSIALPDGQRLIIVTDQSASAPYGIDEAFIENVVEEERAELIGVTPYGHLAWLGDLAGQSIPDLGAAAGSPAAIDGSDMVSVSRDTLSQLVEAADKYAEDLSSGLDDGTYDDDPGLAEYEAAIKFGRQAVQSTAPTIIDDGDTKKLRLFTACVDHRHGTNAYAATSPAELQAQLAEFCREFWSEVEEMVEEDVDTLTDAEIVSTYFDAHSTEFYDTGETSIEITPEILAQLGITSQPVDVKPHTAAGECSGFETTPFMLLEWLTDEFGNTLPGVTHDDLNHQELSVLDRATLHSKYWGGRSNRVGFAVKHEGETYHAIEIKETWNWGDEEDIGKAEAELAIKKFEESLLDPVTSMGGTLLTSCKPQDNSITLLVLLPFHIAADAHSNDDYYAAVDYLINGRMETEGKRKQVFAEFRPQAWVNDYAVQVDPSGDTKIDVTFDLLLLGYTAAMNHLEDDAERDSLRYSDFAPTWVQEHTGPFEVDLDQHDIDELFTIIRPAKAEEPEEIDEMALEGDPDSIELPDHYEIHEECGEWSWFEMNGMKTEGEGHGFKTEYAAKLDAKCWEDEQNR